jgi:polyhydroxybutyrate depolymerase
LIAALAIGLLAPAAASAACPSVGHPYASGVNCRTVDVDGYTREFLVYVPAWAPFSEAHPLVTVYHGSGETGEYFLRMSGWRQKADQTGLIAVFPTGVTYKDIDTGLPTTKWNDGKLDSEVDLSVKPPGYPATAPWPANDVGFTDAMLNDLETYLPVDRRRVYASGFSNGASFTARLAAERSTTFAAAAFSAGSLQLPETAARAIPTFMTVGSLDDRILAHTGTPPLTELPMNYVDLLSVPVVASTVDTELSLLGLNPIDYGTDIAAHETEIHWPAGDDPTYRFMLIQGLQHRYPNGANNPAGFVAADAYWRFFADKRLP